MNWTVGNLRLTDVKGVLCKNFNRPNANFTLLALVSLWLLTFTASLQKAKWRRYVRTASLLNHFRDLIWMEIEIKNNKAYCFSRSIKSLQAETKDCPDEYHINSLLPLMEFKVIVEFLTSEVNWIDKLTKGLINLSCMITRRRSLLVFPCMGTKVQKTPWCTGPVVISELVRHLEVNSWKHNLPAAFRSQFSFSIILFFSCTLSHNGTYTEQISSYSDERSRKELHAPLRKRSSRNVEKDWILGSQV